MYVNIYANVEDYPADPSMPSQGPQEECNVCGEGHATAACPLLGLAQKVDDKSVPSRARLSLPPTLALVDNADGEPRVTAREDIPVGTQFGPVEAPRYRAFKGNPRFKLKVFPTKGRATCLDTSDEYQCNWMCFVEPAPEPSVQNLIAYQLGQDIYFSVQRPVGCGDTLYVGYAPPYGRRMAGPVEEPAPAAVPAATEFPTEPGGPPAKRKRGRPPRSAQMTRPTKVTIVSKTGAGQGVPPGTVVNVQVVSGESPADERQQQQWTCSQCGRLYRDSVVFARHLQDHYRPAYLKELSGRMRGGRPRPPLRPPPPAAGLAASADNIQSGDVQQDVAMLQEIAPEKVDGAELSQDIAEAQLAIQADGPVADGAAVSQVEAALDDGSHTQVLIQLQDGSIHEILSFDASVSLPGETTAIVGEQQQHETNPVEDNASSAVAPIAVTTLDQLQHFAAPQDAVVAVSGEAATPPQLMTTGSGGGARRGRKPKSSGASRSADVLPTRRFTEVERQSAGKYNLRTTRKALVVDDEENAEDDSDYEGDDLSDYESGCEGEYASGLEPGQMLGSSEQPVTIQLAGPLVASAMEEGSAMPSGGEEATAGTGGVPQELHVAVEMLTSSLPCQSGEQASTPLPAVSVSESLSAVISETLAAETTSGAEATATREDEGGGGDSEGGPVVEKFYASVEQVRQDRPKRPGRYSCDLCGKGFNQTLYLFRHIRKHTGEFTCHRCRRVFARKENLQSHACSGRSGSSEAAVLPCSVCNKTFHTDRLLRRHMAKHTGQHMCPDCGRSYTTREILSNHACPRRPREEERFSCGVCGKAFTRHGYLLKHLPVHTGQHTCPVCGKWLRSPDSLANHLRMCTRVQEIQLHGRAACSLCHQEFTNAAEFRRHQYEHTHVHQCETCGGRFRNLAHLGSHVCQGKPQACEACAQLFDSVIARDQHQLIAHGEPQFKCDACGRGFYKQETLSSHPCVNVLDAVAGGAGGESGGLRKRETSLTPLVCEICGSTFSSTSSLNVHKNLHGEKRFQCDMCGKRFHRKDLLLEHHAVHGDPTFPCPTCRKLFKTKKSLDVHMMIHTGVKRFKCSVCAKEFFQKGNLQKHEDTHLSERRHRCAVCQKVFATRESLARHALEHTRGRLFPCAQCGRAFIKEHQLRNHQRVFHSDQLYSCRFCGLSLKLRHSLKRHLRKKHPDREHQWGSPGALTAMLVSKVPDGTELGSDMGLDPDAVEESLQHAAESATNPSVAGFEVAFEGDHMGGGSALSSAADSDMVQDTSGSIVANVMGEHGSSEVLLAVEGLSSEELREAIASGRAQIKQGPTPDTIEISMPFDAADEGGPQVTYMANLVDPTDQVVVDDGSSVMATDQPDVLEGSEAALGRPMSGHYVVSEEGGSSELAEGMAATGSLEEHAAVRSLQDPSAVAAQLDSLGATDMTIKKHFGSSLVTFRPIMTNEEQAAEADATAGDGDTSEVVPTVASDLPTDLAYEEPQFVVTEEQEVGDDTHVIYNAGDSLHEQPAMPQGTIVLDDGTILQQDDQQGNPTDLLLYVLTTSDTQDG
ncbi:uncharacterized protein LOC144148118 isoform X2 [Haemaphysalis longicornis]